LSGAVSVKFSSLSRLSYFEKIGGTGRTDGETDGCNA